MAVTTRNYSIANASPAAVLKTMETALADLGWMDDESPGYLLTFSNTPGRVIREESNKRYLIKPSSCTSNGTNAVFDVLRTGNGAISAVTLVTGGKDYLVVGSCNANSSGITVTVPSTENVFPGMLVTKIAGTGTLAANTLVASVTGPTTFTVTETPSVALSGATGAVIQVADIITLGANTIGGNTYNVSTTASSGSTVLKVTENANVYIGQRVIGPNIGALSVVTAIAGLNVTVSKATTGTVSGEITYSDEISIIAASIANYANITGITAGTTIINVPVANNIHIGSKVEVVSGPTMDMSGGDVFVSSWSGSGPFTVTLRNASNTFKGFESNAAITFKATTGDANTFFASDLFTNPVGAGWAIAKITNDPSKVLGATFWNFYVVPTTGLQQPIGGVTPTLYIRAGTGFNANANTLQGVSIYDWYGSASPNQTGSFSIAITLASNSMIPLTLRVRQSDVDPNFATFSFFEGNNNRNNFFLSKYNTGYQPWDLNDVFLGGVYELFVLPTINTFDAGINFRTRMTAIPKRMAEAGYGNYALANNTTVAYTNTYYRTNSGNRQYATPVAAYDDVMFYVRQQGDVQTPVSTTAVFKNIPINPAFAPVPYYLPSDFILAELPFANPEVGDTLTVSGSEIYTIIQAAINQTTYTGIVVAARTT